MFPNEFFVIVKVCMCARLYLPGGGIGGGFYKKPFEVRAAWEEGREFKKPSRFGAKRFAKALRFAF